MSAIRDIALAPLGLKRIEWVRDFMPCLEELRRRYAQTKPFQGVRVSVAVHLEAKTAYLSLLLRDAGAQVAVTGSNPLSTKDDICAALAYLGMEVNAWHGATAQEYREHQRKTLEFRPHIIIDDGADFISLLDSYPEYASELIGGCEETTTGIARLHARAEAGTLRVPMMAVNDANCKRLFDNRHGTGQSVWDGIMYSTNNIVAGKTVVIAGYGYCSSGIALRARGLGANVIVTEVDPFKALEAAMDGNRVMTMDDAAELGDIFITATGCKDVIVGRHFARMKHNAMLANAGHFDVEINKRELRALAVSVEERKPFVDGYTLEDGRVINLLSDGRLVNIVAGNGHPAEIMDLSFAIQFLGAKHILDNGADMAAGLYPIPEEIDRDVACIKLRAMGLGLDELTDEQRAYLEGSF
ncbi:MAG: adenosylhomocysteinase [Clostridia bacterium]|nr:adenosylhomocysteinase [Clostridia bacterium]